MRVVKVITEPPPVILHPPVQRDVWIKLSESQFKELMDLLSAVNARESLGWWNFGKIAARAGVLAREMVCTKLETRTRRTL